MRVAAGDRLNIAAGRPDKKFAFGRESFGPAAGCFRQPAHFHGAPVKSRELLNVGQERGQIARRLPCEVCFLETVQD